MPSSNFHVSDFMTQKVRSKPRRNEFMTPQPVVLGSKQSSKRRHQSAESRVYDRTRRSKPQRRPRPKTPTADKRAKNIHKKRDSGWTQRQLLPKTFVVSIKSSSTTPTHQSLLIFWYAGRTFSEFSSNRINLQLWSPPGKCVHFCFGLMIQ